MILQSVSNEDLIFRSEHAVHNERTSTADVVRHFQEISDRKLFLEQGFPSLYEMVTKYFGYCAGSAMRRINSMRLIREIPAVEAKIEAGEISLSVASDVQSFFYAEAKMERPYSVNAKIELIDACINKSRREVEKEFCRRNPSREKRECVQVISPERVRLTFLISEELNKKVNRLRDLHSASDSNMSLEALLERLVELGLDKHDPIRKANRAAARSAKAASDPSPTKATSDQLANAANPFPPAEVTTPGRYVKAADEHELALKSDGLRCAFICAKTGQRCGSTKFLEIDHKTPHSYGGSNNIENLQYLCSTHNKYRWEHRSVLRSKDDHASDR